MRRSCSRSQRAGRRGTSCRRWRWPTRCGRRALDVVFVGGAAGRAQLVPAAGYELDAIRVEGLTRRNPLEGRRAPSARASARSPRRAGILRELGPGAVLGGRRLRRGPGRAGRVSPRGVPLVLTEADSHLGLTNRAPGPAARRVCLAFPIAGRDGAALPRHRPAVPPPQRPTARRRGHASGHRPPEPPACSSSAGRSARARSTRPRSRRSRRGAGPGPPRRRRRATTPSSAARPGRPLRPARVPRPTLRRGAGGERPCRRPGGRVDLRDRRLRAPGDPRPLPPRDGRPPVDERALDGRGRAPPWSSPTGTSRPERLRAEVERAAAATPRAWPAMAAASAAAGPAGRRAADRRRAPRGGGGRDDRRGPWSGRRLHIVGVGGAGMSAYARGGPRARGER